MVAYWGKIPSKVVRGNSQNVYSGKATKPTMHKLVDSATGKMYETPDDDYRQLLGQKKADGSVEKHIAAAFSSISEFITQEVRSSGGDTGHIKKIEYSNMYKLLRVTFRKPSANGQVVVYVNVPSGVAAELIHLATVNPTQVSANGNTLRHVLGMRFWDLIRIRGTVHGSRYSFKYVTDTGDGRDSYTKGTATPDWSKTNFVLVKAPGSSKLVPKAVDQLSDKERSELEIRMNIAQHSVGKEKGYDVDAMYRIVNTESIDEKAKQSILKEMDSLRKGRDASLTIYNYLRTMGLL